jgi:hypothetical protein
MRVKLEGGMTITMHRRNRETPENPLPEYGEIERGFLEELKVDDTENILRLISILRVSEFFYRDDLAGEADCSEDMVERLIEILLRFKLFYKTSGGYAKRAKFNLFINRFMRMHPELREKIRYARKRGLST